jgi:hypothetical protein
MFHIAKLKLSKEQGKKLLKGYRIKLTHSQLSGSIPIKLTKRQLNKLQKSKRDKVGMMLVLSPSQIRQNVKKGSGFFSDLWSGIKDVSEKIGDAGKYVWNNGGKEIAKEVGKELLKEGVKGLVSGGGRKKKGRKARKGSSANSIGSRRGRSAVSIGRH